MRGVKSLVFTGALTFAVGVMPTAATVKLELTPGTSDEINVTSDSSKGWLPTPEQRTRALKTVEMFLDALDSGQYAKAYALQIGLIRRDQTLAQFTQESERFRALAGPVRFWRALKVTWTKDPARAPLPGIYVSIDLAGQFANVDRDCGYIVLYQQSAGSDFAIMRRENNFIDNAMARSIEEKHSKAELAKAWAQLSRHCPNYPLSMDVR